MNTSPILYFYGNEQLLTSLKNGFLPLSTDLSLLEPYLNFGQYHGEHNLPVSRSEFMAELNREYLRLPDNIRTMLSFEDFEKQSDRLAQSINEKILRNRAHNCVSYQPDRLNRVAYLRLFNSPLCDFGWSTLANRYRGLCIGIKTDSSIFKFNKQRPAMLAPVAYGAAHDTVVTASNPFPGLFLDHPENEQRGEWRAVYAKAKMDERGIKLPNGAVVQAYIGGLATPEFKSDVMAVFCQDLRYRSVSLFEAVPDNQYWSLTARALNKATL